MKVKKITVSGRTTKRGLMLNVHVPKQLIIRKYSESDNYQIKELIKNMLTGGRESTESGG